MSDTNTKRLHLMAFVRPVSLHTSAWQYLGSYPDATSASNASGPSSPSSRPPSLTPSSWPTTSRCSICRSNPQAQPHRGVLWALYPAVRALAVTDEVGLAVTASTTYDEPYHIARRFASLDHLSGGRASRNIVTTANRDASKNFGRDEHKDHGDRFADDAFVRNRESGIYFDPDRMHVLDHRDESLSVRGPLNIARPVQGWPAIVQAGQSDPERQLVAETAEAVFCSPRDLSSAKELYAGCCGRITRAIR